jgi:hypothetical protein
MRKLSEGQRAKVERALEQHQSFSNAWFWTPNGNGQQRGRWADKNSWSVGFKHEGVRYVYTSTLRCSAKNVYYRGYFEVDDERKTVRAFKRLVGQS